MANTTHKTILGDIKFAGSENIGTPGTVSQWQKGEFEVVWPQKVATAKLNPPSRPGSNSSAEAPSAPALEGATPAARQAGPRCPDDHVPLPGSN